MRGLKSNAAYLNFLCSQYQGIIGISEHWLHSFEQDFIKSIHNDYYYLVQSIPDVENPVFCHPKSIRGHGVVLPFFGITL